VKIYRGRLRLRFFSLAIASGYDFGDVIMGFHDYITQHVHVVALLTTFQSSPLFFTQKKKRKTDGKLCSVPYPLHLNITGALKTNNEGGLWPTRASVTWETKYWRSDA
jgi:hypothetical protein